MVNKFFTISTMLLMIIIFIIIFFYSNIIGIFTKFSQTYIIHLKIAVFLLLPTLYLGYINDLLSNVIQAYKNFKITNVSALTGGLTNVCVLIFLAESFRELSIVIAYLTSYVVQCAFLLWHLKKYGKSLRFSMGRFYNAGTVRRLIPPVIFQQISALVVLLYPNYIASGMDQGTLTAVGYARKIFDLLPAILILPLSTALAPLLTEIAAQKDNRLLSSKISQINGLLYAIVLPVSIFGVIFSYEITRLFFARGALSEMHVTMTAESLRYFLLGLFVIGSNSIIGRAIVSTQNVRMSYISLIFAFGPLIGIPLSTYIASKYLGYLGISIGYSLYLICIHQFIGFFVLQFILKQFNWVVEFRIFIRLLAFSALAVMSVKLLISGFLFTPFTVLTISSLFSGGIYLTLHYLSKSSEYQFMVLKFSDWKTHHA